MTPRQRTVCRAQVAELLETSRRLNCVHPDLVGVTATSPLDEQMLFSVVGDQSGIGPFVRLARAMAETGIDFTGCGTLPREGAEIALLGFLVASMSRGMGSLAVREDLGSAPK